MPYSPGHEYIPVAHEPIFVPSLEEIRRIVREELARAGAGPPAPGEGDHLPNPETEIEC